MITLLLNNGEQGDKHYTSVVPWMESLMFKPPINPARAIDHEAQGWTLDTINSTPNRRFFKSHSNLKQLPVGSAKGLKVIYVARNPKDVSVSLFHHARNKQKFSGDQSDMIRRFVQGRRVKQRCENGSWFNHVLEWWEAAQADPEHILFLQYEGMLQEPEEHIKKIADFAGIKHTPEIISKTAASSTIGAMRQNPKINIRPDENHFRKGGAGGWRDVYTVKESEAFDEIYREEMEGSGLTMDFGEGLVM
ncbi:unnamed protein product [Scytosiphon promiscuus]